MDPFTSYFSIPKVSFKKSFALPSGDIVIEAESASLTSVCRKCASLCFKVHDYQTVHIRDVNHGKKKVFIKIRKKRFWCDPCGVAHSELIPGISHRARTSQRFRMWVCETALRSSSLAVAAKACQVSNWFVFHYFHQMLQVKLREYKNPWPAKIGIDEHSFRRSKITGEMEFVTVFVDHVNKRLRAIALGRNKFTLLEAIKDIKGATAVRAVSIDLSGSYREFVREAFPNADIVADKFHVMRLFGNLIKRERIDAFGDKRSSELSLLLKRPQKFLSKAASDRLRELMAHAPKLLEAYEYKVQMYWIYRKATKAMARKSFIAMLDKMALSKNKKVATLRDTLISWQQEILSYFDHKITNARVEGFNNKCKSIKRRGYGYRNIENYTRRCLGEALLKRVA